MLTSLSRFVAKSAQYAFPLFKLIRKEAAFEWTPKCNQALTLLTQALSQPPMRARLGKDEILYLYLAVASEVINTMLIRETP